jgi:acetyl esterase/lipase
MPGSAGHFTLVSGFVSAATAAGKSLAVLVLQYDLAPAQRYPHQLAQCIDLLRYVVTDLQKPPNQVLLGGDSAGGNMVFGILSHILHPHKAIEPLKLSTSIRAGFAASPVASFNTEFSNELQDPAPASTIKVWLQNYLGSGATDPWNEPVKTDVEWWNGVDKVVKELLITIADNEMMAADTKLFAATLKVSFPHAMYLWMCMHYAC